MTEQLLFPRRVMSISYDQDEILLNILKLHVPAGRFEIDPFYSRGGFYEGSVPQPIHKFDLKPQAPDVRQCSADNLPFDNRSVYSIIADPPFLVYGTDKGINSKMANRFGYYNGPAEMFADFYKFLQEAYRVLGRSGILVFKIQDTISGRKQIWSHCEVYRYAIQVGFYPVDLFLLLSKNRMRPPNEIKTHSARKFHSYFWVMKKVRAGVVDHYKNLLPY